MKNEKPQIFVVFQHAIKEKIIKTVLRVLENQLKKLVVLLKFSVLNKALSRFTCVFVFS